MGAAGNDVDVDLRSLWRGILSRSVWIVLVVVAVTGLAFFYATTATPQYRAATRVLIETRESVYTLPAESLTADRPILDEQGIASQVEVISSQDIIRQVVRQLDLRNNPAFGEEVSALDEFLISVGLRTDESDVSVEDRLINAVSADLAVYRIEGSRVIVIEYTSSEPQLAADIPNAVADAYITVQREAILLSTADATQWLEPEIADLRDRVREAETRVAEYRAETGLLLTQNNEVLTTQQLAELSTELSRVRAERAAAAARAEGVRAALASGGAVDAMPEVLASPIVQSLIEQRGQINAQVAELSTVYLDNHPRIRALRSQLADLDRQVRAETGKVVQALEGEATAAERREAELLAELERTKTASAAAGTQEVELRALEREATTQRDLLESYLTRYREASARTGRNYLPVDARIFSRATPPSESHFPKPVPIIGAALIGSLLLSVLGVMVGELFSGRALRPAPGRRVAPVADLAMPAATSGWLSAVNDDEPDFRPGEELAVPTAVGLVLDRGHARALFVSPEGEAGTAASAQVLREAADGGLRAVFVDLTESGAVSAAMLESPAYTGITNLLCGECQFTETIHGDLFSDGHVIPRGTADLARALRGVQRLPMILGSLGSAYDLVIVECGAVEAADIGLLVDDETSVFVGSAEPSSDAVAATMLALHGEGFVQAATVAASAAGSDPREPLDEQSAA